MGKDVSFFVLPPLSRLLFFGFFYLYFIFAFISRGVSDFYCLRQWRWWMRESRTLFMRMMRVSIRWERRGIKLYEANPMSGVFQNIEPPTPSPPGECIPPPPRLWCGGRTHSLGGKGGGVSIFWKTPDTALYSTYVSTLWVRALNKNKLSRPPVFWQSRYSVPYPPLAC